MSCPQPSIAPTADAVVVGGGIIGTSIAYHLAKKGVGRVLLFERGVMGEGSTGKCLGGIRTQFSTEVNVRFSLLSRQVFAAFRDTFGVDPVFKETGYLFLATDPHRWDVLQTAAGLAGALGVEVELLTPRVIGQRWPFLRVDDVVGGSYSAGDGYAGPYEVLRGFVQGARRLGATLVEGTEVVGIETGNGRVEAVRTAAGHRVSTRVVINAAGPDASAVAALAGLRVPVQPVKRHVFFTDPFRDLPRVFPLVIDMAGGWYMRREKAALLLAGPLESDIAGEEAADFAARQWTAERSTARVPALETARIAGGWTGFYEVSPDSHAIVGSFEELEGFVCANGFSGHGFQHSPAAGILVAELVTEGRAASLDIGPLSPERFRKGELIHEPMTAGVKLPPGTSFPTGGPGDLG